MPLPVIALLGLLHTQKLSTRGQYALKSSAVQWIGALSKKTASRVSGVWGGSFSIVDATSDSTNGVGLLRLVPFRRCFLSLSKGAEALRLTGG